MARILALSEGGGPHNELGTALADSQMRQQASYTAWDFLDNAGTAQARSG